MVARSMTPSALSNEAPGVVYRAQVVPLRLNAAQRTYMAKASGTARVAYNWALAEWKRQAKAWWESGKVEPYPHGDAQWHA